MSFCLHDTVQQQITVHSLTFAFFIADFFTTANGKRLADVPALAIRQLKIIDKVEYCSLVEHLFACRFIGKCMLAVVASG